MIGYEYYSDTGAPPGGTTITNSFAGQTTTAFDSTSGSTTQSGISTNSGFAGTSADFAVTNFEASQEGGSPAFEGGFGHTVGQSALIGNTAYSSSSFFTESGSETFVSHITSGTTESTTSAISTSGTSDAETGYTTFGSQPNQTTLGGTTAIDWTVTTGSTFTESVYTTATTEVPTTISGSPTTTSAYTTASTSSTRTDVAQTGTTSAVPTTLTSSGLVPVSQFQSLVSVLIPEPYEVAVLGTGGPQLDYASAQSTLSAGEPFTVSPTTVAVVSGEAATFAGYPGTALGTETYTYIDKSTSTDTTSTATADGSTTSATSIVQTFETTFSTTGSFELVTQATITETAAGITGTTTASFESTLTSVGLLSGSDGFVSSTYPGIGSTVASSSYAVLSFFSVNSSFSTGISTAGTTSSAAAATMYSWYSAVPIYDDISPVADAVPTAIYNQPARGYRVDPASDLVAGISMGGIATPPPFLYNFENLQQVVPGQFPVTQSWSDGSGNSYTGSWSNGSITVTSKATGTAPASTLTVAWDEEGGDINRTIFNSTATPIVAVEPGIYSDLGNGHSIIIGAGAFNLNTDTGTGTTGTVSLVSDYSLLSETGGADAMTARSIGAVARDLGGGPYTVDLRTYF